MSEEAVQQKMSEIYDPDTLKQHFHTEPDERIRQKDVPERLQLIFEKREAAVLQRATRTLTPTLTLALTHP